MEQNGLMTLKDLLLHQITQLYFCEQMMIDALPKMAAKAGHPDLKRAFDDHLEETKHQRDRLQDIANILGLQFGQVYCTGMEGLIREGEELMDQQMEKDVIDAALIVAAQRIEHYEIACYGTAHAYAELLKMDEVAGLLEKSLKEEKEADSKLNKIATSYVNKRAAVVNEPPYQSYT